MKFTMWLLLQDFGIIAILILIGQILRAKFTVFQKFLIPSPLIAGFIGLALGPNGLKVLPLSNNLGVYASVLIVLVFASMPIGQKVTKESIVNRNVGGMFFNLVGMTMLQYGIFTLLNMYVLRKFYDLHPGFGIILPTGFVHGHGTAAAIGATFASLGWNEALDLGMTSATFGLVGGILLGIVMINWAARKGYTSYVKDSKDLSEDLLTGLIPIDKQKSGGRTTISGICLDTFTFHLSLVLMASGTAYMFCNFVKAKAGFSLPEFCIAMFFGFILQEILTKTGTNCYVDRYTISRISGTATDLLVVCGVAGVKIAAVMKYFVPLLIIFVLGYALVIAWLVYVAPLCSDKDWFERGMIAFGQELGVLATGILLLRIVDPDLKSRGLEDSGTINIIDRPLIIALQTMMPYFLCQAGLIPYISGWVCMLIFIIVLLIAIKFKWIRKPC